MRKREYVITTLNNDELDRKYEVKSVNHVLITTIRSLQKKHSKGVNYTMIYESLHHRNMLNPNLLYRQIIDILRYDLDKLLLAGDIEVKTVDRQDYFTSENQVLTYDEDAALMDEIKNMIQEELDMGVSTKNLAEFIGVSRRTIYNIQQNMPISAKTCDKILDYMQYDIDELIERSRDCKCLPV